MSKQKRVFIVTDGNIGDPLFLESAISTMAPDFIICADGGARHIAAIGIVPGMIVGDMDSVPADTLTLFARQGVEIRRYPAAKDATDTELAFAAACEFKPSEIFVFGALGHRLDHTLANLSLLLKGAERNIPVKLLDAWCEVFLISKTCTINGESGQTVSLLPLFGTVTGVSLSGFQYPLEDGMMSMTAPFGISNRLAGDRGIVTLKSGVLLVVRFVQKDAFPS